MSLAPPQQLNNYRSSGQGTAAPAPNTSHFHSLLAQSTSWKKEETNVCKIVQMISVLSTTVRPLHDQHFISHENVELSGQFSDLQYREKYLDTSLWFLRIIYSILHRLGVLNSGNVLIGQTSLLTLRQSSIINFPRECGGWCGDVHDVVRSTAVHWSRPRLILIFTDLNSWSWKKCLITQSWMPVSELWNIKVCGSAFSTKMFHAECEVLTKIKGNI